MICNYFNFSFFFVSETQKKMIIYVFYNNLITEYCKKHETEEKLNYGTMKKPKPLN